MNILHFEVGDLLEMKKPHPCGSPFFLVKRIGSDVRIICKGCARDITVPRIKLERGIRRVITVQSEEEVSK